MKKLIFLLSMLFIGCFGCIETKTEYSEPKKEKIEIVEVVYTPATHGSGGSVGFTTGGEVAFSSVGINTKAKYSVVCKCVHGKFIIEDSTIWANVETGDIGYCYYSEQFTIKRRNGKICSSPILEKYNLLSVDINGKKITHKRIKE